MYIQIITKFDLNINFGSS